MITAAKKTFDSVTMLRGIAAMGVCLTHVTGTVETKWIQQLGIYAGDSVYMFFVISGFVIPYAMEQARYQFKSYPLFIVKRVVRLDPPYLATIVLIFVLGWMAQLSPHHIENNRSFFTTNTLHHFLYLIDIKGGEWYNPVFWTLAIEFQYYLLIGILFPLIAHQNSVVRWVTMLLFCSSSFLLPNRIYITGFLLLFCIGIFIFWFITKRVNKTIFFTAIAVLGVLSFMRHGTGAAVSLLLGVAFLLWIEKPVKPLMFLGAISYSFYLLHVPIGTDAFIQFFQNYITTENGRIILMLISLPVILLASWVFYKLVEEPTMKLSKRVRYSKPAHT